MTDYRDQDGKKHPKNAGNSAVGEKRHTDPEDQTSSSDDDDDPVTKIRPEDAGHSQGQGAADAVVAGEQIHIDEDVSDKKRKKLAAREAKKKRDQLVSKMIKGAETGLGGFADTTEMFTKYVSLLQLGPICPVSFALGPNCPPWLGSSC